jgi:glutamyl-tRNA reductase
MSFLAVGVEHRTAPLAVREAAAMDADAASLAARELLAIPAIDEVVVLSTCNRTELYLVTADTTATAAAAAASACLSARRGDLREHLQTWREMGVAERLFRVASGLESQALGELQILAQVRGALAIAESAGSVGPNLHSLFRSAIACARQARAGTALGRVQTSIGLEAVRVAERALASLQGRTALVIGGGEISRLVAGELRRRGIGGMFIANRTQSVAVELASRLQSTPARLDDIPRLLPHVDLVISATGAHHFVLAAEDVPDEVTRRSTPLEVIDLAVPRDIDPAAGEMPGVNLRDLDDLLPDRLGELWRDDIAAMEAVIAAEVKEFESWYLTRRVVPVIASLRAHVEAVSEQELRRVAPQLAGLSERERAAVESLTGRLIDKMFHHLVVRLRLAAQSDPKLVEAAEFFFLHGEGGLFEHAAADSKERQPALEDRQGTAP